MFGPVESVALCFRPLSAPSAAEGFLDQLASLLTERITDVTRRAADPRIDASSVDDLIRIRLAQPCHSLDGEFFSGLISRLWQHMVGTLPDGQIFGLDRQFSSSGE